MTSERELKEGLKYDLKRLCYDWPFERPALIALAIHHPEQAINALHDFDGRKDND